MNIIGYTNVFQEETKTVRDKFLKNRSILNQNYKNYENLFESVKDDQRRIIIQKNQRMRKSIQKTWNKL